jgi:hypothetical protein
MSGTPMYNFAEEEGFLTPSRMIIITFLSLIALLLGI